MINLRVLKRLRYPLVIMIFIAVLKRLLAYKTNGKVLSKLDLKLFKHYSALPKRIVTLSEYAYLRGSLFGKGKLEYGHSSYDRQTMKLIFFAVLGDKVCGHPGVVHGGMIAGIFDDIFGELFFSHAHQKYFGYTANLNVNYKSKMPAGSVVAFVCQVDRQEGRKVFVKGVAKSALVQDEELELRSFGEFESTVYADATALFIIPREEFAKLPQPYAPPIH